MVYEARDVGQADPVRAPRRRNVTMMTTKPKPDPSPTASPAPGPAETDQYELWDDLEPPLDEAEVARRFAELKARFRGEQR
jgi:hypothetical protein